MAWFCDWITARLPLSVPHAVNGGYMVWVDNRGRLDRSLDRSLQVVGSHDARMQVRTIGHALEISGSPPKFMLGHNLYGPDSLAMLPFHLGLRLCGILGVKPAEVDISKWLAGEVSLTRIDVTRMYRPEWAEPGWVAKWLDLASRQATAYRQRVTNRGAYDGNTLYHGQHSRRISTKIYDKGAEIHRHRLPDTMSESERAALGAYAADTLRVEVTIRAMELKRRGLDTIGAWNREAGSIIINERLSKLSLPEDLRMTEDQVQGLPPRLLAVYDMWRAGRDLRQVYSKAQFYRYRSQLLAYDIDIAHVQPHEVVTKRRPAMGRPLRDFIAGPGLEPPESALPRIMAAL